MVHLKFKDSLWNCNFAIEHHFSLAKWPPLLSVACSASDAGPSCKTEHVTYIFNILYCS